MDYKKIYYSLIETRKFIVRKKREGAYYEKHHILPTSLGGTNDKENLVLLTAKEHFVAHLLLTKMYEGEDKRKMIFAFWRLCNGNKKIKNVLNGKQYEDCRKIYIEQHIKYLKESYKSGKRKFMHNKKHTIEAKEKISIGNKGKVISESQKKQISKKVREKYNSKDENFKKLVARRMSERMKGKVAWNKGLSINTTCPHCGKTGNYRVMPRWHFDNCKNKNEL